MDNSTANALCDLLYLAKDVLFVVDEYKQQNTAQADRELRQKAETVLRAQGNLSGRERMDSNRQLIAARPPRGLTGVTGELLPDGASLRARLVLYGTGADPQRFEHVLSISNDARAGLLAQAMSGFVQYVAERAEGLNDELAERSAALLAQHSVGTHRRTPANLCSLLLGVEHALNFAVHVGAIDAARKAELWNMAETELLLIAEAQTEEIEAEDEVKRFLAVINTALMRGSAFLERKDGEIGPPKDHERACGWTLERVEVNEFGAPNEPALISYLWHARGRTIGWFDGESVMLDPASALAAAEEVLRISGRTIGLGAAEMGKRLKEAGLTSCDTDRPSRTTRTMRATGMPPRKVWMISAGEIWPDDGENQGAGGQKRNRFNLVTLLPILKKVGYEKMQ